MRNRITLATVVLTALTTAADTDQPSLGDLKGKYGSEVSRICAEHSRGLKKLLNVYGISIGKAIETLKQEGDPDNVLLAIMERKRFDAKRTVPVTEDEKLPQVIKTCQSSYRDAVCEAGKERDANLAALTEQFIAALDRLMKALTVAEKLDLALNVKDEIRRSKLVLKNVQVLLLGKEVRRWRSLPVSQTSLRLALCGLGSRDRSHAVLLRWDPRQ